MSRCDFDVAWTPAARRSLNRLPEKIATAVIAFIYGSLAANPPRVGKPLRLHLEGLRSARRGDYRIIYRIHDDERRVDVIAVGHDQMPTGPADSGSGTERSDDLSAAP